MAMWHYNGKVFEEVDVPADVVGFVYLITNMEDGRRYIGKKRFKRSVKKPATKKRRAVRTKVTSDWADYYGSCKELQEDVASLGKDKFRRDILFLCRSLGEMSYREIAEQIDNDVLFRKDFYNTFVGCRIHANHLKSFTK